MQNRILKINIIKRIFIQEWNLLDNLKENMQNHKYPNLNYISVCKQL